MTTFAKEQANRVRIMWLAVMLAPLAPPAEFIRQTEEKQ